MRFTRRKRTSRRKTLQKKAKTTGIRADRVHKPTPVLIEAELVLVHVGGVSPHQRLYRRVSEKRYQEVAMTDLPDDWWPVRDGPLFTMAALRTRWNVPVSIQPISLETARKIYPALLPAATVAASPALLADEAEAA